MKMTKKTLFIREGVTFYLHEDIILNTLELINTLAPLGSMICFDYMTAKVDSIYNSEPFLFWVKPDELSVFMSNLGFDIIEHIHPEEMEERFLALENGILAEKTLPFFSIATGVISGKLNEVNT